MSRCESEFYHIERSLFNHNAECARAIRKQLEIFALYRVPIDRGMKMVAISVKCLPWFVLIAFSLAAVSDSCTSDADCDKFFSEICCNNECVDRTSGCCSEDSDCLVGESCCNHKCKLDCDDSTGGDNFNPAIELGIIAGIVFIIIIWVAICIRNCRRRRPRYILIIEENEEITVSSNSNNTGQLPSNQQGYSPAPPPYTPPSTTASGERLVGWSAHQPSYGTV